MTLIQSIRSCSRSHVLHGPSIKPDIQHLAPKRTVTESHLLGVCSATDAEQNGVLLGLPPAATVGVADGGSPRTKPPPPLPGAAARSSLQAAASTERHSVRASVAEQTPNRCDSVADLFGARRWISGFLAEPCSTCDRERDQELQIRAIGRKGLRIQVAVQRGQTAAAFPLHVNCTIPGLTD